MKNFFTLTKSSLLLAAFAFCNSSQAATYIAGNHGKFTDEKIWYPAYPGNYLKAGDSIIIAAHVVLNTPLTITGTLSVDKGASLQGNKDVAVSESGKLINLGNTVVRRLLNEGQLDNRLVFETMMEIDNRGIVHNNSTTVAGTSILNQNGVLAGNKGAYFSNSAIISSPSSIYEQGLKVFEASYTNPMAEIDESLYCSVLLYAYPKGEQIVYIELLNAGVQHFETVVMEKSADGVNYRPFAELDFKNNQRSIEDAKANTANVSYRAFAYDAQGKKYRIAETFVKNIAGDETLSLASRISH